ncbi:MAG: hypothetical protein IT160_06725 [Bryobacterales bacterium]|nr:hypothetical protein [Bryobacterales bacterium]
MRLTLWALLGIALIPATAADWNSRSFPGWNDHIVERILTDSPWTRPVTIRLDWISRGDRQVDYKQIPGASNQWPFPGGSPVGGIGAGKGSSLPDRADILVRWASALPVRQATALYKQRQDKLQSISVNQLVPAAPADYIVELFGVPSEVAHRGTASVEAIARGSAALKLQTGRVLKPNRVEALVHAGNMEILVHFSREEPILVTDREVEFSIDMQIFSVKEKFRLFPMRYQGDLQL